MDNFLKNWLQNNLYSMKIIVEVTENNIRVFFRYLDEKSYSFWIIIYRQLFKILAHWFSTLPIQNLIKNLRVEFGVFIISLYANVLLTSKNILNSTETLLKAHFLWSFMKLWLKLYIFCMLTNCIHGSKSCWTRFFEFRLNV